MNVQKGMVVGIAYTTTVDGKVIEATVDGGHINYVHGEEPSMLVPALEQNIEGMGLGEERRFSLSPEEGYGLRYEANVIRLPRAIFPVHVNVEPGARLAAKTLSGDTYPLTVVEVHEGNVVVDLNHPLAGKTLEFVVKVVGITPFVGFSGKLGPSWEGEVKSELLN